MKISIWMYEDNSRRDFNTNDNVSNFRIFQSRDLFGDIFGLLIYPKKYEAIKMEYRHPALLKQNRRIFERLGNYKAIKHLELNS